MSNPAAWSVYIDGAARGNPGPAAFAFVITRPGAAALEEKGCLGATTNNLAEYTALLRALERAAQLGAERLIVHSDSELLVKQMNGEYKVRNEGLRLLNEQAQRLLHRFERVTIRHVPRAQNSRADRLCNEALDGQAAAAPKPAPAKRQQPALKSPREEAVREEALLCLRAATERWARGGDLPPEAVWDQLWSILEEHGVLKR